MPMMYRFLEYVNALSQLDWFYDYSDDHLTWRACNTAMELLQRQAKEHKAYRIAFDA